MEKDVRSGILLTTSSHGNLRKVKEKIGSNIISTDNPAVEMSAWLLLELGKEKHSGVMLTISPFRVPTGKGKSLRCDADHITHQGAKRSRKI